MTDVMGGSSVEDPRAEYVPDTVSDTWEPHHHMAATPVDVEITFPDGKKTQMKGLFRTYANRPGDTEPNHPGWTEWEAFGQLR